ncbi:helix-turn-helix transcriptional regulator [Herbaspirillum rhizosphaerae]|uniref:helix-turn-helix transcriptional regulator n=1 Tax=Herbaspirillum rhizosphaerae TaxID=346179 RepID=UPI00067AD12C|nr:helix-turn-helix transcriptional regulator [Herbaspirillum rhizosphaerae]
MQNEDIKRKALGEFIKSQREQTSPALAGLSHLSHGTRRRTPGLRREEVAQLCGISVTWYTWIEQGRTDSISPQALSRIADALHLPRAKRAYLFELAEKKDPVHQDDHAEIVAPEILDVVRNFRQPAYVLDRYWNALACNVPAKNLFAGWLSPKSESSNLLYFTFCTTASQELITDWEQRARRLVGEFRADCGQYLDDPQIKQMVEELSSRSSLFKRAWSLQDVVEREGGERLFRHPVRGTLTYQQVNFRVANRPDLKLITLMPA